MCFETSWTFFWRFNFFSKTSLYIISYVPRDFPQLPSHAPAGSHSSDVINEIQQYGFNSTLQQQSVATQSNYSLGYYMCIYYQISTIPANHYLLAI